MEINKFITDFFKLQPPSYKKDWEMVYNQMAVHTNKKLPEHLISKQRPNETDEILAYRLCNYRPITFGSMNRALDELYRIVSGIGYKINAPENVVQLLTQKKFNNVPFTLFLQQCVLRKMIEDPNALLVWLPSGAGLTNDKERIEPVPYVVNSCDIYYSDSEVLAFLSNESSPVKKGKGTVYEGKVYYILTRDKFYKLVQIDLKSADKYRLDEIYTHSIGELPYCILGGDMSDYGYFNSYFAPYVAFGDEAICRFTDWQAMMVNTSYPFIEEFQIECEVTDADPNKSSNPVDATEEKFTGRKYTMKPHARSPHGTIVRKSNVDPKNPFETAGLAPDIPSIRFIQANPESARYGEESWKSLILMAEDALHLNLGRGLISGKAKEIDLTAQNTMISKIGNNFFDNIMLSSVIYVDAYYNYNVANHEEISIDKPSTYNVKTEADIVDELTILKEKNAPSFFLQESSLDLAKKRFSGDKLSQKIFKVISLTNPLFIYSIAEKQNMLMSGVISKEDYILDLNIYFLLLKIADEKGIDTFVSMEVSAIQDMVYVMLKEYLPEAPTPIVENA